MNNGECITSSWFIIDTFWFIIDSEKAKNVARQVKTTGGERDRYWTCIYIGPPRFLCLEMRCRLMWPTGAYTAAPLVDWRSENGGQYAQAKTVGIIRFVTSLFYF